MCSNLLPYEGQINFWQRKEKLANILGLAPAGPWWRRVKAPFLFFSNHCALEAFFLDSPGPKKWFCNPSLHMMSFYYSFAHISAAQLSAGIPIGFCWQRPRGKEIDPTPDSPNMQRYYSLVSETHFTTQRAEEIRNATQLLFVICWWIFIDEGRLSNKKGPSSVLYTYWWSST